VNTPTRSLIFWLTAAKSWAADLVCSNWEHSAFSELLDADARVVCSRWRLYPQIYSESRPPLACSKMWSRDAGETTTAGTMADTRDEDVIDAEFEEKR